MRIDSRGIISSGNTSGVNDLVSRLDKGDVISAKVLETSQDEVVLRLSDGTILKAGTVKDTGLKAGDLVTLSVKSRSETSIILEIVTELSPHVKAGSDKLRKLLESLGIEPDEMNLKLASELLIYNRELNADDMAKASDLIRSSDVLDPEKAAFIVSNKIDPTGLDHEMLVRLLDGELKLGQLLESLAKALELLTENKSAEQTVMSSDKDAGPSVSASATAVDITDITAEQSVAVSSQDPGSALTTEHAAAAVPDNVVTKSSTSAETAKTGISQETMPGTATDASIDGTDALQIQQTASEDPDRLSDDPAHASLQLSGTKSNTEKASQGGAARGVSEDIPTVSLISDVGRKTTAAADREASADEDSEKNVSAAKIKSSIEGLFVRLNNKLSSDDIGTVKMGNRIGRLLADAEALVRSPQFSSSSAAENAARVLSLVTETIRMIELLNSYQVLYYQLPVNLGGETGTAELYVMKRKQGRKKIDPHDTVIFLSLDTLNMGRVETLLDVKGQGIGMDLRTESQAVSDFIRNNITSLYSSISESGYKLVNVKYSTISGPSGPVGQEKLLLAKTAGFGHGKIDFRI